MFQGIQCVVRGADHIKVNKVCQDAAKVCEKENFAVAAVSDGHGGTKYIRSDVGSKFAVEAAVETVCDFMEDYGAFSEAIEKNPDYVLSHMERYFITKWNDKIELHHDEHALTEEEQALLDKIKEKDKKEVDWHSFYGCTILIAVLADTYSYGMLVGDGTFAVVYEDGTVEIPIDDPYSVANMTSSVCDKQCKDKFQHYYEKKKPLSMTVSSDGLCKSFGSEEKLKDYHVRLSYMMNTEQFLASLEKNLLTFTNKGSGDDISVATVFDVEGIFEKKAVLLAVIEEKKKQEQERQEAEQRRIAEMKRKMEQARLEEERRRQEEERRRQEKEQHKKEAMLRKWRTQEKTVRELEEECAKLKAEKQESVRQMEEERAKMQQEKERYMQEIQKQKDELCRQAESMQRTGQEPEKSQDPGTELPVSEYKNGTDALQSLADGATVMGQRLMEGIGQCVDLLEIGAARMEDVISRKLEEQADRMAEEERSNTKENKEE